jgi:hypothetical protein
VYGSDLEQEAIGEILASMYCEGDSECESKHRKAAAESVARCRECRESQLRIAFTTPRYWQMVSFAAALQLGWSVVVWGIFYTFLWILRGFMQSS